VTYRWDYHPTLDVYFLMGPWKAPDGRLDHEETRQYGHIKVGAGHTYWACHNIEEPVRFDNLHDAMSYLTAIVSLS
jgi:hypothetical protein